MAKYTYEQRMKAVLDVTEKHMACGAVGKLLGCGKEHVRRWVKRYEQFGVEGLILKNGSYTGEFKQHVIEYMHKNHLSISETAVLFGIPSNTHLVNGSEYFTRRDHRLFTEIIVVGRKIWLLIKQKKES